MIILDENVLEDQRQLLEARRIPVRQIGYDILRKGMKDEQVLVELRALRGPTFFTRDAGFYSRTLCHRRYCLAVVQAGQHEVAAFVSRFLRHTAFRTQSQRLGKVVRLSPGGLSVWQLDRRSGFAELWH